MPEKIWEVSNYNIQTDKVTKLLVVADTALRAVQIAMTEHAFPAEMGLSVIPFGSISGRLVVADNPSFAMRSDRSRVFVDATNG